MPDEINLWTETTHAERYLQIAYRIPRREEGEASLLECLPARTRRVLDLGSGEGRLIGLLLDRLPEATGVAVDFSDLMLDRLHTRFSGDARVEVRRHDLDQPLPDLGAFDAIVSSFAIHHLADARKRALYAEVHARLAPGGVFLNLEHVASPTPALHQWFLAALGVAPEDDDPSNKLTPVETQLVWLREIGFDDVDCHWKWRELALLAGTRPLAQDRQDPVSVDVTPTSSHDADQQTRTEHPQHARLGHGAHVVDADLGRDRR